MFSVALSKYSKANIWPARQNLSLQTWPLAHSELELQRVIQAPSTHTCKTRVSREHCYELYNMLGDWNYLLGDWLIANMVPVGDYFQINATGNYIADLCPSGFELNCRIRPSICTEKCHLPVLILVWCLKACFLLIVFKCLVKFNLR